MKRLLLPLLFLPFLATAAPVPLPSDWYKLIPPGRDVVAFPQYPCGAVGCHLIILTMDKTTGLGYSDGISCPKAKCLSWATFVGKAQTAAAASAPASAASAVLAKYVKFNCTKEIRAEQTPRGDLCRERKSFEDPMWVSHGFTPGE